MCIRDSARTAKASPTPDDVPVIKTVLLACSDTFYPLVMLYPNNAKKTPIMTCEAI